MEKLEEIKRSEIISFLGEVCYIEMLDIIGGKEGKNFWIKNKGMNSRAFSKDIVDLTSYNYVVNDDIKEAVFIHLSRNSIYHQLPESFFHPLVISNPSMSNAEVVDAIRKNKKVAADNLRFFIPFDTKLFEKRVRLTNRYLNIFTDTMSVKILYQLARKIIDKDIPFSKEQYYKFFLKLCNAEKYKENLPLLEELLQQMMGYEVALSYQKHLHKASPFGVLGEGILGLTLGLQGETPSEFEDLKATMIVDKELDYKTIKTDMTIIHMILEYFIFSNRQIIVEFQTKKEAAIVLGENYLGYNTVLVA